MFTLDSQLPAPLVSQIVDGFRRLIEDGQLRAGTKLPSIRRRTTPRAAAPTSKPCPNA